MVVAGNGHDPSGAAMVLYVYKETIEVHTGLVILYTRGLFRRGSLFAINVIISPALTPITCFLELGAIICRMPPKRVGWD